MVKMRINVTKDVLEKSKMCGMTVYKDETSNSAYNCAIALAVRDIFPFAAVLPNRISPFHQCDLKKVYSIELPKEAINFIEDFDSLSSFGRASMSPIFFDIEIPDEVINRINIEEVTELLKDHPTLSFVNA